jgi:glycosyltransferase involved in cell wall biosynthesis
MDRRSSRVSRPRVVHVTTSHAADDVRIFERECRSLAASGSYDVFLAAHGSIPSDRGVTLIPFPSPPTSRAGRFASGPYKAIALARVLDADIWHFHDPELLPVALRLAHSGRRVIWDAHEDYLAQFTEAGAKSWIPRGMRGLVLKGMTALLSAVDRGAAAVVAATPRIASRYTNSRTVVVGNEARLEDFDGCRPDFAARRVLFTGSLGTGHLFPEIVDAIAGIPDVTLAVAGRTPDSTAWANAKSRLGERVVHLGWLDRTCLADAISKSSVGLVTYANLPPYDVAAPTKLFEFSAAGLPGIATPNRSNADFVQHGAGAFLSRGFSASDISETIASALSDRESWVNASLRGREWAASEGSWAASETRLLELYRRVAGGIPAAPGRESGLAPTQ